MNISGKICESFVLYGKDMGMSIRVASLFCGCGGMDMGFVNAGYDIVWANDIDKYAVETYNHNFTTKAVCKDINIIDYDKIPKHDLLIGGFPCQPFSMMGLKEGFKDKKGRGELFYRFIDVIDHQLCTYGKKPLALVLENVRNLQKHDHGRTFEVIRSELEKEGYTVHVATLNSSDFGVPQTRRRTFIVALLDNGYPYKFPKPEPTETSMLNLLERDVDEKYYLSERVKKTILSTGTGGYYSKYDVNLKIGHPLTATMGKMHRAGEDNYVDDPVTKRLRKLTPRECARLQGFEDSFIIPVSNAQAYKQFGNAVTVNVAQAIGNSLKGYFEKYGKTTDK